MTVALALTIFGVSTVQSGYTSVLGGTFGLAFGLLVFILLGVLATSGGSAAPEFLPDFWNTIGGLLPPRATMELIKDQAYFGGEATGTPMLVLRIYRRAGRRLDARLQLHPAQVGPLRCALRARRVSRRRPSRGARGPAPRAARPTCRGRTAGHSR